MIDLTPGARVCSKVRGWYYRIPGTIQARAQVCLDNRAGWEYIVELDNGQRVMIHELDMDTPTEEDIERFAERERREQERDRMIRERNERRAEGMRKQAEARANRGERLAAERAEQQEAKRQANNDEQRRAHAAEYGRRSLKR